MAGYRNVEEVVKPATATVRIESLDTLFFNQNDSLMYRVISKEIVWNSINGNERLINPDPKFTKYIQGY